MGLPFDRDYTAVAGGEIDADGYNNVQDWIKELYSRSLLLPQKRAFSRTEPFGPREMVPVDPTKWEPDTSNDILCWKRTSSGSGVDAALYVDVPLEVGDRLVGFTVYVYEASSLTIDRSYAAWTRQDMAAFEEYPDAGTLIVSSGANAAPPSATAIVDNSVNQTIANVHQRLQLIVKCKTPGTLFSGGHLIIDHP